MIKANHDRNVLQDIFTMSTNFDRCGYRDNDNAVKSGSAIPDRGGKITLKMKDRDDFG